MASLPRLFVEAQLPDEVAAALTRDQVRYLLSVMRRRPGDEVLLFNGRDGEWRARIAGAGRRDLDLEVVGRSRPQAAEPGPTLWFAPLKRGRQELLLEKACELGVARLRPVLMRRSVVEKVNLERQRAILIEAAEQSGRLTVPALEPPVGLDAMIAPARDHPILWADEAAARPQPGDADPLLDALRAHPDADLLIGPEGGFDADERSLLLAAPGIVRVGLGPRILRAETAALVALAGWRLVRRT